MKPRYRMPAGEELALDLPPRLASWNRADHPDQIKLAAYLRAAEMQVAPRLSEVADPISIRLDVAVPPASLTHQHDLDNFLLPLVTHLTRQTGRRFVSAWGTKQPLPRPSTVRIEQATSSTDPLVGQTFTVLTTASSAKTAYKQEVRTQVANASQLPAGAVWLELAFTVGPTRSWPNLWKPTIDALDPILGQSTPGKLWNPQDGRIVQLGLHCHVERSAGNQVRIEIAAGPVTADA